MQSRRIKARGAVSSHATVSPKVQDAKTKLRFGHKFLIRPTMAVSMDTTHSVALTTPRNVERTNWDSLFEFSVVRGAGRMNFRAKASAERH